MALGAGVLLGRIAVLTPKKRCPEHGEPDLDRQHTQGDQGEQPAVDQHHRDIDHREGRIEQGGEGLTGEEIANLLQLGDAAAEFTHGPAIEIVERQSQQVVDHLGAQPHVDAVGGFTEQEGAQGADQPLHQGHHHQGKTQHLQGVETALVDHLVDDHLDQQGVGQAEQLHHK